MKLATNSTTISIGQTYNNFKGKQKNISEDYYKEKELNSVINTKLSFIGREKSHCNDGTSFVSTNMLNELNTKQFHINYHTPLSIKENLPKDEKEDDLADKGLEDLKDEKDEKEGEVVCNFAKSSSEQIEKIGQLDRLSLYQKKWTTPLEKENDMIKGRISKIIKIKPKDKSINVSMNSNKSKRSLNSKLNSNKKHGSRSKSKNMARKHNELLIKKAETNRKIIDLNKFSYVFDDVDTSNHTSRINITFKDLNKNNNMNMENDFSNKKYIKSFPNKNLKTIHKNINFRRRDELD